MVDWDTHLVTPTTQVFGEPVTYTPQAGVQAGVPILITAIFDEGYTPVAAGFDQAVMTLRPVLGVQVRQMPAGFDAENAQGDTFVARGRLYVVKSGKTDSHGAAILEANRA